VESDTLLLAVCHQFCCRPWFSVTLQSSTSQVVQSICRAVQSDLHWLFKFRSSLEICLSPSFWVILHLCVRR